MPGTRLVRILAAIAVAGLAWLPASASTFLPADFSRVVAESDTIVVGRVTDVRTVQTIAGDVETVAAVRGDVVIKGDTPVAAFLSVRVPGGTRGRYRTVVPGAPTIRTGDAAVFFLRRYSDGWRPTTWSSAIFQLELVDQQLRVHPPVVADATATAGAPVARGDLRRRTMPLGTFESLVRVTMAAGSRR
jgi:hypothetical protein